MGLGWAGASRHLCCTVLRSQQTARVLHGTAEAFLRLPAAATASLRAGRLPYLGRTTGRPVETRGALTSIRRFAVGARAARRPCVVVTGSLLAAASPDECRSSTPRFHKVASVLLSCDTQVPIRFPTLNLRLQNHSHKSRASEASERASENPWPGVTGGQGSSPKSPALTLTPASDPSQLSSQ